MNDIDTEQMYAEAVAFVRNNLKMKLKNHVMNVVFTKNDGTERKMLCTLDPKYIPSHVQQEGSTSKKKENLEVLPVYDIEKEGWRSFRIDSVISFHEQQEEQF